MKRTHLPIITALSLTGSLMTGTANAQSSLMQNNYPPMNTSVKLESSNLPLVWITTTGTLSRTERSLGHMRVINNADGVNYSDTDAYTDQTVEFDGPIAIKWRGSSSFGNDNTQTKKPMSVKLLKTEDLDGKKSKVALLGMGKDSDWCFLAPWQDRSYLRDVLTMQLARGGYAFSPQMKYCEVFMDGIYYGLFILCERASKGSKRLDIWDFGEDDDGNRIDDMTGDFHVEIDRPEHNKTHEEEPHYTSKYHPLRADGSEVTDRYIIYQYKDPEEEEFADLPGAREALHQAIDDMEDAFASENYGDLYADHIDVESWMDYEIAVETANSIDGYRLSTPLWKHSKTHALSTGGNDKWKLAIWDFNLAYGNTTHFEPELNDWRYNYNDKMIAFTGWKEMQLIPFYWQKLMQDEVYVTKLKARYTQRRMDAYSDSRIDEICDSIHSLLSQGSQSRDNRAWGNRFNDWVTQINNVKRFAKSRLAWMDERWYDPSLLTDVTLTGTTLWKDGAWNTICLPFRLNGLEGTPLAGATVKSLVSSDFSDGTLTLNFTKKSVTSLEAGRPYIVKWENGDNIMNPVFEQVITTERLSPVETDYVDFVGCFSPVNLVAEDKSVLYLGADNTLYYPNADMTIGACHGYFRLKGIGIGDIAPAGVNVVLNFDGETTSIDHLPLNIDHEIIDHAPLNIDHSDDTWYSIDGRKLSYKPTKKGIYIQSGRKIVIE